MRYYSFEVSIASNDGLKFLSVVAVSVDAARADIREAYGPDVDIVCITLEA